MKVFAISGWKQSGKDTSANYLVKEYGFKRFGFADVLKDMVAEQYGIPREHCDSSDFKEKAILTMPVETKDAFGKIIHTFMQKEFRDQNGIKYGSGDTNSVLYWTPRALCILEGSIKRSATSNYWVSKVVSEIKKSEGNYVISDLRYKSEVEQLKKAFGEDLTLVRVNRFKDTEATDPSERDLDDYDFDVYIDNYESSLQSLHKDLNELMTFEKVEKLK